MITIEVKIPREKMALLAARASQFADPDGPLDAVGKYVSTNGMFRMFATRGEGSWKDVLRGGDPLDDTGKLKAGFTYAMGQDGQSVVITNTGRAPMIQWVQNFGMTIHAKNFEFLHFKIGDRWVKKRSVTIPPRPFFVWIHDLRESTLAVAKDSLAGLVKGLFS